MTTAEDRVLKPLDPVPNDVNEWPDFALREVKIFYQGKGRYADLLEASEDTPLCVLGELMPLHDEQEHLAFNDNPSYTRMKIDQVTNYSFGQDDDGKPVVWAAGKAGWYEISPSDRYLQHYNDTIEAIELYYFMVDHIRRLSPKRRRLGFRIDPFLTAYQKHTGFRIHDDDEAMETIHKHHKFLMKQMFIQREDVDWSQTHLWNHLSETYPDEVEQLRILKTVPSQQDRVSSSDIESPPKPLSRNGDVGIISQTASPASPDARSEADSTADSESSSESEPEARVKSTHSAHADDEESESSESMKENDEEDEEQDEDDDDDDEDDKPDSGIDWTRPIFDLLNVLRKKSNFDIRNCGISELATEVMKMPAFPANHKKAMAVIERHAEPLLLLMNEAKLRKKFNWSTRAIYAELEATLADDVAARIRLPVGKRNKDRHRMKSVLRPSGASKSRKRTRGIDADDEDEEVLLQTTIAPSSPISRRHGVQKLAGRHVRATTADTVGSRDDSPSRQLNGYHHDPNALPELPPMPEAQDMIDLVLQEAKRVGRQNQTSHLQAFLGGWEQWD